MLVVALGLIGASGWFVRDTVQLRDRAIRIEGRVSSYTTDRDNDGDTTFRPTYEFRYRGERRTYKTRVGTSSAPLIGERETLLVDRDDRSRVRADTFTDLWFTPTLLGGIGVMVLIGGVLTAVLMRKAERDRAANDADRTARTRKTASATPSTDAARATAWTADPGVDPRGPFL